MDSFILTALNTIIIVFVSEKIHSLKSRDNKEKIWMCKWDDKVQTKDELVAIVLCSSIQQNRGGGGRMFEESEDLVADCNLRPTARVLVLLDVHQQYLNCCCVLVFGSTQTLSKAS